jgi:hypothetical protein
LDGDVRGRELKKAEAVLRRSMMNDYYNILDVHRRESLKDKVTFPRISVFHLRLALLTFSLRPWTVADGEAFAIIAYFANVPIQSHLAPSRCDDIDKPWPV